MARMSGGQQRVQAPRRIGEYEVGGTLGEGTFAKVKYAVHATTGEPVAMKVLDKEKIIRHKMVDQIKREISVMKLVRHPNVVRLYEVLASRTKIYIILEFVTGGELFDKIVNKGRLEEEEARRYFQQLIDAMEYCHSKGVAHRDLKADGLLHTTCGTPNYVAPEVLSDRGYIWVLADIWSCRVILYLLLLTSPPSIPPALHNSFPLPPFTCTHAQVLSDRGYSGVLADIWSCKVILSTSFEPLYRPSELSSPLPSPTHTLRGYNGVLADIWSCGVILYVLLAGFLPFDEPDVPSLYKKVPALSPCSLSLTAPFSLLFKVILYVLLAGFLPFDEPDVPSLHKKIQRSDFGFPTWFSAGAKRLITGILQPNPKLRYRYQEIKKDPWFRTNYVPVPVPVDTADDNMNDVDAAFGAAPAAPAAAAGAAAAPSGAVKSAAPGGAASGAASRAAKSAAGSAGSAGSTLVGSENASGTCKGSAGRHDSCAQLQEWKRSGAHSIWCEE
ncbi:unnamed protein product [Closterium sp. NIES-65]|nr:unnamed protein product [Closterium sp. NIES-65]